MYIKLKRKLQQKPRLFVALFCVVFCLSIYWLWHEGVILFTFEPPNQTLDVIQDPVCISTENLEECGKEPPCLVENRKVIFDRSPSLEIYPEWPVPINTLNTRYQYSNTQNAIIKPQTCTNSINQVAIIIPYRNRISQLQLFLTYMLPTFIRQEITFKIYIIEQAGQATFNRARLLNAGFDIAQKELDWDCYVFHDVDLVLENDKNLYRCHPLGQPHHFLVAWSKYNYLLRYPKFFGGIVQVTKDVYTKANGHSNEYWGWGGEDDDFYQRVITRSGFSKIHRPPKALARYKMVPHIHEKSNAVSSDRYKLLQSFDRENDGLSNLEYKIVKEETNNIFSKFTVNITLDE